MTKSELIGRIVQKQTLITNRDVEGAVNAIQEHMTERLATGGRIEIRGFGAFSLRHRKGRVGRNPNTAASVELPAGNGSHPGGNLNGVGE